MKKYLSLIACVLAAALLAGLLPAAAADVQTPAEPKVQMIDHSDMVLHYEVGQSAERLQVVATKSDDGTLSYQWYVAQEELDEGTPIDGAQSAAWYPDTSEQTGILWYYCVVTNTLDGAQTSTAGQRQAVVVGPTVTVEALLSVSDNDCYVTGDSGVTMALQPVQVPYFDLGLYGLQDYYFSSETYGSDGSYDPGVSAPSSDLEPGTSTYAYGKVTLMHLLIYALEVHYLGLDAEQAGQGYLYEEGLLGTDVLAYSGSAGSTYMVNFWGHDENFNYYRNYTYPLASEGWGSTSDQILVRQGDIYTVGMFDDWSFHTNPLAGFHYFADADGSTEAVIKRGESRQLTLYRAYGDKSQSYGTDHNPVTDCVEVYITAADEIPDGDVTSWQYVDMTDENGTITVDTSDLELGEYLLCVAGRPGEDTDQINSAPGGIRLTVVEEYEEAPTGDVNADGKADSTDAVLILRIAQGNSGIDSAQADVDLDGDVDADDARLVLKRLAEE